MEYGQLTFHQYPDSHECVLQDPRAGPGCTGLEHEEQGLHDGRGDGESVFAADFPHQALQRGTDEGLEVRQLLLVCPTQLASLHTRRRASEVEGEGTWLVLSKKTTTSPYSRKLLMKITCKMWQVAGTTSTVRQTNKFHR